MLGLLQPFNLSLTAQKQPWTTLKQTAFGVFQESTIEKPKQVVGWIYFLYFFFFCFHFVLEYSQLTML